MMLMKELRLVERRPRECRLRRADVDCLLAEQRGSIEVVPTGRRGVYRLTARGRIGVIITPGCRIRIRAKVPLRNLFHLLGQDDPFAALDDQTDMTIDPDLLDVLALRLAELLDAQGRVGLHRGYVERREEQAFLQGRLDVAAQMRESPARRTQFHCVREEFTADGPWNQLPRAAAEALLHSGLLAPIAVERLRNALPPFQSVQFVPLGDPTLAGPIPGGLPEGYAPLLRLAGLVALGLGPADRSGSMPFPAFLIDLERVFELGRLLGAGRERAGAEQDVHRPCTCISVRRSVLPAVQGPGRGGVALEDGQFMTYDFATWRRSARTGPSQLPQGRGRLGADDPRRRSRRRASSACWSYDKLPKQTVKFNRRNIFARDHNQCQYCGKKFPTSELSLDHVIPRSQGGGRRGRTSSAPAWTATSARAAAPRGRRT
jgi:hypothetical protein